MFCFPHPTEEWTGLLKNKINHLQDLEQPLYLQTSNNIAQYQGTGNKPYCR